MAKQKRIFVTVNNEQLAVVKKLMIEEDRSQSFIATKIFEDGLKLVEQIEYDVVKQRSKEFNKF